MEDTNQNPVTSNPAPQPAAVSPTATEPAKETASSSTTGMDNKKLYAIVGYLLPILFFLPLIDEKLKTDASARFHANQQLVLLIAAVLLHFVVAGVLGMILGPLMFLIGNVINLAIIVLAVMGVLNVINGEDKELPLIGGFKVIK